LFAKQWLKQSPTNEKVVLERGSGDWFAPVTASVSQAARSEVYVTAMFS
jgi:hypothetical protein